LVHTDAEAHSFSRRRAALAGSHSGWLDIPVAGNKAQSLFAAAEGLVCKRSSNLIQILTIKVRI